MKKVLVLTLLVLLLIFNACTGKTSDTVQEIEVGDISLLVELITSSEWSDLEVLNPKQIQSLELISLTGEPAYYNLDPGLLELDQNQQDAEQGVEVGILVRYELENVDKNQSLEFVLSRGCSNTSTVAIYQVMGDTPTLVYHRDYPVEEGCDALAFHLDLNPLLAAQEKLIQETAWADEAELEVTESFPETVLDGFEVEILSRTDGLEYIFLNPDLIQSAEIISISGEPAYYELREDGLILDQEIGPAEQGQLVGINLRFEVNPQEKNQSLQFLVKKGCLNDTILRLYRVVDGDKQPILFQDDQENIRVEGCNPVVLDLDPANNIYTSKLDFAAKFQSGEPDPPAGEFTEIEIELTSGSNWMDLNILNPDLVQYKKYIYHTGEPINLKVELDKLLLDQSLLDAISGERIGLTAHYWIIDGEEDQSLKFQMIRGCLGESTVRIYTILEGERILVPLADGQETFIEEGCDPVTFQLNLATVRAAGQVAAAFDDLPMVGHLSDITGEVLVRQAGMEEFFTAREEKPVNVDAQVLTGTNAGAYITVSDGSVIRLGANTIFSLEMALYSEEVVLPQFRLELGEMEIVSGAGGFLIFTPGGVAGAIGSAATVTVSPEGIPDLVCQIGECFLYDGTPETEAVKNKLPDNVASLLEANEDQINPVYQDNVDTDNDGVPDQYDLCPEEGDRGYGLDSQGCPISYSAGDNDGDGILNDSDYCPYNGDAGFGLDPYGCPFDSGESDRDHDGYSDDRDLCPDEGSLGNGVDRRGCPNILCEVGSQDWDGDGVPDCRDRCPMIYVDHNGYYGCPEGDLDFDGIPDHRECTLGEECNDRDGDGVSDGADNCPDIPWTPTDAMTAHQSDDHGCIGGDDDRDGVPDDKECEGCEPPEGYEPYEGEPGLIECVDRDGDGVCLEDDLCPFVTGSVEDQGCPIPLSDSDGDGVWDKLDLCPGQVDAGYGVDPFGCPKSAPDADGDGVNDPLDKCPAQGDLGSGLKPNGCPESDADQDGDGFADDKDKCPKQGDAGHGLGRDGCPLSAPKDTDGDGVIDANDQCPNQGDEGKGLRANGCPKVDKTVNDPDGDGVLGVLDKCPNQGGKVDRSGCPLEAKAKDADGDGVPDSKDKCPEKGNKGYGLDAQGCPVKSPDSDGDGVNDNVDKCVGKGDQGFGLKNNGCPKSPPDADGDGIPDNGDKCPNKGDQGHGINRSGCPLDPPPPPETRDDQSETPKEEPPPEETEEAPPPEEQKEEPPPEEKKEEPPPEEKKEEPPPEKEPEPTVVPD